MMPGWNDHVFPRPRPTSRPSSWWAAYAAQHSRVAFDRALALQLPRLMAHGFTLARVNIITAADEGCVWRHLRRERES